MILSQIRSHGLTRGFLPRPCSRICLDTTFLICLRKATTSVSNNAPNIKKTRNIGIIAHIDAGKTTTTERMLYYSGYTRRIGDVDDGSTVTDFLPAERARGITIQSAAVTFHWPPVPEVDNKVKHASNQQHYIPHTVNLIDTPGHADFTFEVLRSLRILDGAVCVLDGVAGVEAQTEKVWLQANKYSIPRIIFVNKLDRDGAAFGRTVKEIGSRLKGLPAVCQIPWWEGGKGRFTGVGDAINLCSLKWDEGGDGKTIQHYTLSKLMDTEPALVDEIKRARVALVEALCEFDEQLLETWMEHGDDSLAISAEEIWTSLRRCVIDGSGRLIPVFAGASFRNIGVQPLLDAINNLLPNPSERPDAEVTLGEVEGSLTDLLAGKLPLTATPATSRQVGKKQQSQASVKPNIEGCALAFKVVNDARRGILVYFRVYSGTIKRNATLWNTNLNVAERANRLLQMYASDAVEIMEIPAGQIGVIAGLKYARTGDTLISMPNLNPKTGPPGKLASLQLRPIEVPPPVFFAAIEPHSLSEEKNVADILALLLREDPSLHVNVDEESGQMLLSGMGELHLEIARDRLVNDFKAKATMGNIEIGYRECILSATPETRLIFDREIAGRKGKAGCTTTITPLDELPKTAESLERDGNVITVTIESTPTNNEEEPKPLPPDLSYNMVRDAMVNGAVAALARGPRRTFPLHNCHVSLTFNTNTDLFGDTTLAALSSVARLTIQRALLDLHSASQIGLMEPVMNVVISCDEASLGGIVHDISSARGGQVLSLGDDNANEDDGEFELKAIDAKRIYTPPDPFASSDSVGGDGEGHGQQRHVTARVPLKEMVGYLKQLRSLTGGRGTFIMSVDRFERLSGPREKALG